QEAREDRGPRRERFEGKGRDRERDSEGRRDKFQARDKGQRGREGGRDRDREHGGRDKGGRDKRESGPALRQYATSANPRDRDRAIDPNSPFAKLAALKEQLAGGRKE